MNIKLTLNQVAGSVEVILISVFPYKKYENGQPVGYVGYAYTVVCPDNKYNKILVKIEEAEPEITQEQIDNCGGEIKVTFKGFTAGYYTDRKTGELKIWAKAQHVEVVK